MTNWFRQSLVKSVEYVLFYMQVEQTKQARWSIKVYAKRAYSHSKTHFCLFLKRIFKKT
jgi:hypothetical protein